MLHYREGMKEQRRTHTFAELLPRCRSTASCTASCSALDSAFAFVPDAPPLWWSASWTSLRRIQHNCTLSSTGSTPLTTALVLRPFHCCNDKRLELSIVFFKDLALDDRCCFAVIGGEAVVLMILVQYDPFLVLVRASVSSPGNDLATCGDYPLGRPTRHGGRCDPRAHASSTQAATNDDLQVLLLSSSSRPLCILDRWWLLVVRHRGGLSPLLL
jgi:hypothetical protein